MEMPNYSNEDPNKRSKPAAKFTESGPKEESLKFLERIEGMAKEILKGKDYEKVVTGKEKEIEDIMQETIAENKDIWSVSMPEVDQTMVGEAEKIRALDLVRQIFEKLDERKN